MWIFIDFDKICIELHRFVTFSLNYIALHRFMPSAYIFLIFIDFFDFDGFVWLAGWLRMSAPGLCRASARLCPGLRPRVKG